MTILGRCHLAGTNAKSHGDVSTPCGLTGFSRFGSRVCLRSALERGFTLVEVMIIVAVIGVLASIAIPIYADYSTRTKMAEVILAASACRTAISEVYSGSNTAPGAGNWGCESTNTSKYVSSITTDDDGVVTVTVANASPSVDGLKIQMVPYISGPATIASNFGEGIKEWRCGPTTVAGVDRKLLPNSCRY